jgi:hypothetical protein
MVCLSLGRVACKIQVLYNDNYNTQVQIQQGLPLTDIGLTISCAIVPTNNKVVSLNPTHGKMYSIQHYVIKFVNDLRQVCSLLWFPLSIKLTTTIQLKYC